MKPCKICGSEGAKVQLVGFEAVAVVCPVCHTEGPAYGTQDGEVTTPEEKAEMAWDEEEPEVIRPKP